MKKAILLLTVVGMLAVVTNSYAIFIGDDDDDYCPPQPPTCTEGICFDFNPLPWLGCSDVIEPYMEGIYGSDINVTGGIVGDGITDNPLGPDHYIQAGPSFGTHYFQIEFVDVPITALCFDWYKRIDAFEAYADGVEIFSQGYNLLPKSGNTGVIHLSDFGMESASVLMFSDNGIGEIAIDNLCVKPVPVPAAVLLGLIGFAVAYQLRRYAM